MERENERMEKNQQGAMELNVHTAAAASAAAGAAVTAMATKSKRPTSILTV